MHSHANHQSRSQRRVRISTFDIDTKESILRSQTISVKSVNLHVHRAAWVIMNYEYSDILVWAVSAEGSRSNRWTGCRSLWRLARATLQGTLHSQGSSVTLDLPQAGQLFIIGYLPSILHSPFEFIILFAYKLVSLSSFHVCLTYTYFVILFRKVEMRRVFLS